MQMDFDSYQTILHPSDEVLFKDRNSKFFGYAFPIRNQEQVKAHIDNLKKQHHSARHWCYAYQIGVEKTVFRANDDGEPNNSAGMPIYGQIQSYDLTNILIVVVRYFGGTKLGVGGLINAYRSAAKMALEKSRVVERTINKTLLVSCTYDHLNKVMRIIKEKNQKVLEQDMHLKCQIKIQVRLKEAEAIYGYMEKLHHIQVEYLD